MRRPHVLQRWPLVLAAGARETATRARRIAAAFAGTALVASSGLLVAAVPAAGLFGIILRVTLGLSGMAALVWAVWAKRPPYRPSGSCVEAREEALIRVTPDGQKTILTWDSPFGVALLASYGRPHALLAFTTPSQTRYVPTRIDERSELDDELFSRIAVLADLDLVDGVAHDAALLASEAAELVRFVERRDRDALGRVFLSDGRGAPIALDRANLTIGERTFDLTSSLEWRPLMFHESTGQAAALYQATWVRQAGNEVVLVAPMPASIVPRDADARKDASGRLGRALTRELKLLQAPAEPPPARDVRVAIDRPFMMAVRRALDAAPLAIRISLEPSARTSRPERRA